MKVHICLSFSLSLPLCSDLKFVLFFRPVMYHFLRPFKPTLIFLPLPQIRPRCCDHATCFRQGHKSDIIYYTCCISPWKEPRWLDYRKSLFHVIKRQKKTCCVLERQIIFSLKRRSCRYLPWVRLAGTNPPLGKRWIHRQGVMALLEQAVASVCWPVACFIRHLSQLALQCLFFQRLPQSSSPGDLRAFSCL